MTAPVRLSVILVNWNTREMTLACLRSLYQETRETAFEVLLVDNGSHDGSAEAIAREFPQVRLLAEPVNHGFAKANNIAAEQARGELLLLLNTDTLVLDGAIDKLVAFAGRRPEAGIWGGRTVFRDGRLNPTYAWGRITAWSAFCLASGLAFLKPDSRLFNPEAIGRWAGPVERDVDVVSGCFFLIRTDLWRALGGFDPDFFMYGEEADLCARARARGARPRITPDALIAHFGGGSATQRTDTIVYLTGARIGLAKRYLPRVEGALARAFIVFAAWWRARLYGLAARLTAKEGVRTAAGQWREVWRRRGEWRQGPIRKAL